MDEAEKLSQGPVLRGRRQTEGERVLLVLVDSSGPYHHRCIVDETVLRALEHFGFPYRLVDLAAGRPTAAALSNCAGIVIAQDGLAGKLTQQESNLIAGAVKDGAGLVNLDWDLRNCKGPMLEVFGFEGIEPQPIATNLLRVRRNDHYITGLQQPGAFHQIPRMVTALWVKRWRRDVAPLVEAVLGKEQLIYIRHLVPHNAFEPHHYPVVFAGRWGAGRAVQFTLNPRLWRPGALGHLGGLTDVFWRAIVWTVKKPFAANMIPPFVSMSFDDCIGRHDFKYLDISHRYGYIPLAGVFINELGREHESILREKVNSGEILLNTHGGTGYYQRFSYNFGVGEYSIDQLERNYALEDDFYARLGVRHCRTVRGHFGEIGVRALPFLKARDRTFLCTPIHVGEHKADQFPADGYWPFNSLRLFYDWLPDDNAFLIFGAFNERHLVDFLTGATEWLRESPCNDIEKASSRAAEQICTGLNNGFFADVLTHEQKLDVLSLDEWDRILSRTEEKVSHYERIFASHDEIAGYICDKDKSWISRAAGAAGTVEVSISGSVKVAIKLSVFTDLEEGVERRFLDIPAFKGESGPVVLT